MKRLIALIMALCFLLVPATAFAYNPLDGACGGSGATAADVCGQDGHNSIYGPGGVLEKVTLVIAIISGIAAVIVIIVAALRMVTSGGNSSNVEGARNAMIGAVVGLVIILVAATIITFVINKI